MRRHVMIICSLVLVLMLLLSACAGQTGTTPTSTEAASAPAEKSAVAEKTDAAPAEGGTIKFYIAAPMTGDSASLGLQIKSSAQIAVDEINAAGGIGGKTLTIEVADDQANADQASIVAEKIINDDECLFVLGHNNSGCSLSALPTYQKVNMPVISPTNTNPTICQQGYGNFFRIIVTDQIVATQIVDMAVKELEKTKIAIIWENTDYGKASRDVAVEALTALGMTAVGDESYVAGVDRDYSSQVTKFKAAEAEVVLFFGEYTACALFAKQNKSLGLNAEIVASNGSSNEQLIGIGGSDVEGVYVTTCFNPYTAEGKAASYVEAYSAANDGGLPGEWGSHAYDVVYLAKAAYENGGTTRDTLIEQLHALKGFEGITGKIEFDADGDISGKKVMIMKVEDGTFKTYTPTKF